jgi:hypothetical protein
VIAPKYTLAQLQALMSLATAGFETLNLIARQAADEAERELNEPEASAETEETA